MKDRIGQMAAARETAARELRFFDANIWLGRPDGFPLAEQIAPAKLGKVLERRFITGGLVSHWHSKRVSAQDGNDALAQALQGQSENLFAVWSGLPLYPAESGSVPGSADLPTNIRAVRIFPKSHNFPLADWCIGSLCEWLIARSMPLLIWHVELDWQNLYRIAKLFPELRIVVETQTQKILYHTRPLFAVMRDCSNVLVELSNFAGPGFIKYAVKQFGAQRLIFGSFLPANDPLVPMGMVLDADISKEEKTLIAGNNLRRLIAEARL